MPDSGRFDIAYRPSLFHIDQYTIARFTQDLGCRRGTVRHQKSGSMKDPACSMASVYIRLFLSIY